MTDPIRLLHGEGDDLEVSLLRAGAEEIPSAKARRRVLVAVGVGSAGAATAAATNAGAAAAATQASSLTAAGLPAAWTVTAGAMVKWVGIAVVGAAAAWGLSESASPPPAPPVVASWGASGERIAARAAEGVQQGEQRVPPGDESVAARGSERPAREPRDGPRPEAASTEAGPATEASGPAKSNGLADEVAALDRARAAMSRGEPSQALAALSDYHRRFGSGALGLEAEVIGIEALAASGRRGQARAAAERFTAAHPSSPYTQRVRSVLQQTTAGR